MVEPALGAATGGGLLPLPSGARDVVGAPCRRRAEMVAAMSRLFEAHGFGPVSTPLVEYAAVIDRGLSDAEQARTLRFVDVDESDVVALRSDVTPQVARLVAQSAGGLLPRARPLRLYYAADVLRRPTHRSEQLEQHQVGLELLGDADAAGDAELVRLGWAALRAAGVARPHLELADARIARRLRTLCDPAGWDDVYAALLARDPSTARRRCSAAGLAPAEVDATVQLLTLAGPAESVLPAAEGPLNALSLGDVHERLTHVLELLARFRDEGLQSSLHLDFGEVRGCDYYTGLRIRAWVAGLAQPVLRGGRYDELLAAYGHGMPAAGLAIDLDRLEQAVPEPAPTVPKSAVVWVRGGAESSRAARAAALELCEQLRHVYERAWVELADAWADAEELGDKARASRVVVLDGATGSATATITREPSGWQQK